MQDGIDPKKVSHSYDKISEVVFMPSHFYESIVDFVSCLFSIRGLKILDTGCGQGLLLKELLKHFPDNEVYGIDFSRNLVKMAKALHEKSANLLSGDALRMPFREGSFDLVICSEVVEHVVDPNLLLKSINSCVKHGGYALFTLPNALAFYPLYALFQHFPVGVKQKLPIIRTILIPYEDQSRSIQPVDHTYTSVDLLEWLRKHGFEPFCLHSGRDESPTHIVLAKLKILSRFHERISPLFKYYFIVITKKISDL